MKVFISADIEGVTGTTHWDETEKKHQDYTEFREQMTAEVAAACEGALEAGATEIWVKDAHDSARNIIASQLPREVRLTRGWSGHPYCMMDGLNPTFQASLMIGYHARASSASNPLSHTMSGNDVYVRINDQYASEFLINAYTSGLAKVPVVFVSGDDGLCKEAASLIPAITSVAVKEGLGNATTSIHPGVAVEQIRSGVLTALKTRISGCYVSLPEHFTVDIQYKNHTQAYSFSFYPGVKLIDPLTIRFESDDYFDVLRMFAFAF
ncbi:MAG: amino acid amidase [Anaerolineaceae bacterium]|nr:amino acid amidase [Anaerolineaceae bacterium]